MTKKTLNEMKKFKSFGLLSEKQILNELLNNENFIDLNEITEYKEDYIKIKSEELKKQIRKEVKFLKRKTRKVKTVKDCGDIECSDEDGIINKFTIYELCSLKIKEGGTYVKNPITGKWNREKKRNEITVTFNDKEIKLVKVNDEKYLVNEGFIKLVMTFYLSGVVFVVFEIV